MGSKSEKEDARRQINAPCRRGKKGKIAQKSYTVFLGIELIFSDIHAESCERKSSEYGNFIELSIAERAGQSTAFPMNLYI